MIRDEDKQYSWIGSRKMSKTGFTEIRSWHNKDGTLLGFDLVVKDENEEKIIGKFDTLKEAKARQNVIR